MKPYRVGNAVEAKPWDRKLWGALFVGNSGHSVLVGSSWYKSRSFLHAGDPVRALLFTTRKAARDWCKSNAVFNGTLRAVRVRETVTVIS